MKYVFFGAFLLLTAMSVVAGLWKPEQPDMRRVRLAFYLEHADAGQDGYVSPADMDAFFTTLDTDGSGTLTREDGEGETLAFVLDDGDEDGDRRVDISELRRLLGYMDINHDGQLSMADMPTSPAIELIWCSDDNPVRREQIRLFNRLNPDYHLTLDPQNATMEKVIVQSLAGVGPDTFDAYTAHQVSAFIRSGVAADLTESLPAVGVDINALWPSLRPMVMRDGKLYGHSTNAGTQGIWFNKDHFDEAGTPYPDPDWTWDDCIRIGKAMTRRNARGQIIRYGIIGFWDWKMALYQFHARVFTDEGTRCTLDEPEAAQAIQFMQDLIYKHEVMPTPSAETAMASTGGWGTGILALFGAGKGAMAIGGRWWLCIYRKPEYTHLRLGAVEVPWAILPDGSRSRSLPGYGKTTMINARSKNMAGALAFLAYMHGEPYNNIINAQADALAPVAKYSYTDEYLMNPAFPEENYNAIWRDSMAKSVPEEGSPYVSGQVVERILTLQTDLVKANLKSGANAMKDAAIRINREIADTLRRDPELRERYMAALAKGASPAWDNPGDAP